MHYATAGSSAGNSDSLMFNIHDERNAAAEAESIIQNLSISAVPSQLGFAVQSLRKANEAAITAAAANPLAEEQLNTARAEAARALSALIDQVHGGVLTQDIIARAQQAIEHWKNTLVVE